jgi:uncharacterized protein (TIGR01777 family)
VNITVTGGTGFIGRRLIARLLAEKHSIHVLARHGKTGFGTEVQCSIWDATANEPPLESLSDADAIIHLAGEPLAQRWTPEAKRRIRNSRVEGTDHLIHALPALTPRPSTLVCASAIGIYGSRGEEILTESSPPARGFLPEVCIEWENTARLAEALGVRVVNIRTGMVLGPEGGALGKMLPTFRWGLGGRLGSGRQWMSWIHIEDLVSLIRFAIDNQELHGPLNATAPNPVRNGEFTDTLAGVLYRPAFLPVPTVALRMLFGEMAEVLLGSQRVLPRVAESAGFQFKYPHLKPALEQLLA